MIQGARFVDVEIDDSDEGAYAERAGRPVEAIAFLRNPRMGTRVRSWAPGAPPPRRRAGR